MQILFALIAIFWWIAVWGLTDILLEQWTTEQKVYFYVTILGVVAIIVWRFPNIIKRF